MNECVEMKVHFDFDGLLIWPTQSRVRTLCDHVSYSHGHHQNTAHTHTHIHGETIYLLSY